MMKYSPLVLQHFHYPQHVGVLTGENVISVSVGTPLVSDIIQLTIETGSAGHIQQAAFKAYGNPYTLAIMSWLTVRLNNEGVTALQSLNYQDLMNLFEMPKSKTNTAILIEDLISSANAMIKKRKL